MISLICGTQTYGQREQFSGYQGDGGWRVDTRGEEAHLLWCLTNNNVQLKFHNVTNYYDHNKEINFKKRS